MRRRRGQKVDDLDVPHGGEQRVGRRKVDVDAVHVEVFFGHQVVAAVHAGPHQGAGAHEHGDELAADDAARGRHEHAARRLLVAHGDDVGSPYMSDVVPAARQVFSNIVVRLSRTCGVDTGHPVA